jgi:hypothetical protein
MRFVGTLQYARLLDAVEYYEKCGFQYIDVPWAVSREAILMTRPPHIQGEPFSYTVGGKILYPVASAEQSFLHLQLNAGGKQTGSFCTITPCFRNEPVIDNLHQPYFMKLELISWDKTTAEDLNKMITAARLYIENDDAGLWVDVIKNDDPDPIARHQAYDIVSKHARIELGSYGIRQHEKVGRWLYGTGLAEPRYSYAIEVEEALKASAGNA